MVPIEPKRSFQRSATEITEIPSTSKELGLADEVPMETTPVDIRMNGECIHNLQIPISKKLGAQKAQNEFATEKGEKIKEEKDAVTAEDLEIVEEITKASSTIVLKDDEQLSRVLDSKSEKKKQRSRSKTKKNPNVQNLLDDIEQEVLILEAENPPTASIKNEKS